MTSANDTAVPARSPFKRHAATLATTIAAICTAALCPLSCEGQTWTGGPTGPIYYNGGNVGIGFTLPAQGCRNLRSSFQRRDAENEEITAEKANRNVFSALPLRSLRLSGNFS